MLNILKKMFGPAKDYKNLIKNGSIVIDVRSAGEYSAGHINNSKNIPLEQLQGSIQMLKKSGKPVITVCRSGNRSGMAANILSAAGIEAYNGGAWTALRHTIK